jgi:hypothetical protein
MKHAQSSHSKSWDIPLRNVKTSKEIDEDLTVFRIIFKARTLLFMLGSITRDPIFCSKARILLQVKNIFFRSLSLMITKRLLDVVSCEFKKKMFKERRSCGSNEGPVKFLSTQDLLSC